MSKKEWSDAASEWVLLLDDLLEGVWIEARREGYVCGFKDGWCEAEMDHGVAPCDEAYVMEAVSETEEDDDV